MRPGPFVDDTARETSPSGEVERALNQLDWSLTPVGRPAGWPTELTTVVRALLSSRFSMWMAWGPELTMFYNDAYARDTLGRKHPWALGRPAAEVWSEIWPDIGPRIRHVLETGEATWDERLLLFLERSGEREETYHTFSYSPLFAADARINGMLCVVTEDTQRVIAERRMATLRMLAAALSTARTEAEMMAGACAQLEANRFDLPFSLVYLFDRGADSDGIARLACCAGISPGHAAAPELIGPDDTPVWPVPEAGERILVESFGERFGSLPTGEWDTPPVSAIVLPLDAQAGEPPAGFLVAALNPLRPFDPDYEGFAGLLADQLAAAVARARAYEREQERARALAALDRAKTEFFSNISHELRTPLTLILAPVEDALADGEEPLGERQRERIEMVRRSAARLRRMVGDILDFSRIERQDAGATRVPVDLAAFTRGLVGSFAPAIERAGLELRVEVEPLSGPVAIDIEMWEKVVLNLLSNALKFTLTGSISVSLREVARSIELEVADTGVGIPEEAVPRLFERFYRVGETRGRSYEGSGIGLALVHELVALHEGTITAESRVGEGSRFVIRIPEASAAARDGVREVAPSPIVGSYLEEALSWQEEALRESCTPSAVPRESPGRTSGATVLVVDDNADLRSMLTRLLAPSYRVLTARDGREALSVIERESPELVVSDVMMPRVDGLELLRILRDDPRTASLPVILLSARAGEEASIGGLEAGADDYLVKPFSARELVARVRSTLELSAVRREAAEALEFERRRLEETLDQLPLGVLMAEAPSGRLVLANAHVEQILGHPPILAAGTEQFTQYQGRHLDGRRMALDEYPIVRALRDGEPTRDLEMLYPRGDGEEIVLRVNSAPIRDRAGRVFAAVSVFDDVTVEVRRRRLLARHREVLGRIAQGMPLRDTLELIAATIEESTDSDDARASILLFDAERGRLRHGAAPSLPDAYNEAIDGIPAGEGVGSCGTAAARRESVVVTDTLVDPLWADFRELAGEHGLRACWSTPITATDGELVGTFAVYHGRPWEPTDNERQLVALMSRTAAVAIERDRTTRARARQFEQMQQGLRPRSLARVPGLEVASRFHPGTRGLEVGGDFYDVFAIDAGVWGFMIGDVCGHGAEAAAATAVTRHTARAVALRESDPAAVLAAVDDALNRSELDRFCTAVYGCLLPAGEGENGFVVRLANGGHPLPLVLRAGGTVEAVREHGPLLGVLDGAPACPTIELSLAPGDALLMYTDGLIERNPKLGDEASLHRALALLSGTPADDLLTRLEELALDPERPALDDVALLALRVPGV